MPPIAYARVRQKRPRVRVDIADRVQPLPVCRLGKRIRGQELVVVRHALVDLHKEPAVEVAVGRVVVRHAAILRIRFRPRDRIRHVNVDRLLPVVVRVVVAEVDRRGERLREHLSDAHDNLVRVQIHQPVVQHFDVRGRRRDERLARATLIRIGERRMLNDDRLRLRPAQLAAVKKLYTCCRRRRRTRRAGWFSRFPSDPTPSRSSDRNCCDRREC